MLLKITGTLYQLKKLDYNICLHTGDNDITLLPVLEILESGLLKKCLCLHISQLARHVQVHSFIYTILEKLRNICPRIFCVFPMPALLLDSAIAIVQCNSNLTRLYFSYLVFNEIIVNRY